MVAPFYIPTSFVEMTHFFYSFEVSLLCDNLILADLEAVQGKKQQTNKNKSTTAKSDPGFLLHSLPEELPFSSPFLMGLLWGDLPIYSFYSALRSGSLSDQMREKKRGWESYCFHHYLDSFPILTSILNLSVTVYFESFPSFSSYFLQSFRYYHHKL